MKEDIGWMIKVGLTRSMKRETVRCDFAVSFWFEKREGMKMNTLTSHITLGLSGLFIILLWLMLHN